MTLHKHVQVPKGCRSVTHSSVGICNIERADELTVVDQLDFLVVPLEELRDFAFEKVHAPVSEWVVPDADSSCSLKFCN